MYPNRKIRHSGGLSVQREVGGGLVAVQRCNSAYGLCKSAKVERQNISRWQVVALGGRWQVARYPYPNLNTRTRDPTAET